LRLVYGEFVGLVVEGIDQRDLAGRSIRLEFQDHGAAHSIYFEDPDGLRVELATYDV
jgi:catechol 2,3-dioxygenase-like lactoylglutathione lyase family enzyme